MSRFAGVLRQVSDGLELPQPTKSRILLEMAGDLEDLYRHYRRLGLEEQEAVRRAEEAFGASEEAIKRLARVHLSGGHFADRVTGQVSALWEKVLLFLWALAAVGIAGRVAASERLFRIVSPFVWVVLALATVALAIGLWKLWELLRRPAELERLRTGLGTLLFVAAASMAVSICGLFYHLRWFAFASYQGAPEAVFQLAGNWLLAVSSLMILGLLTAILAGLAWFVLASLVARLENRRAEALLAA